MANQPFDEGQPLASSTISTTTTSGPYTSTVTSHSDGQGATVDYHSPSSTTTTHPSITTTTQVPQSPYQPPQTQTHASHQPHPHQYEPSTPSRQPQAPAPAAVPGSRTRAGSIRLRRPSSGREIPLAQPAQPAPASYPLQTIPQDQPAPITPRPAPASDNSWLGQGNRRRSSSEPQRPPLALLDSVRSLRRHPTATTPLQPLYEDASRAETKAGAGPPPSRSDSKRKRPGMSRVGSAINLRRRDHQRLDHDIDNDMVDMLDVIGTHAYSLSRSLSLTLAQTLKYQL